MIQRRKRPNARSQTERDLRADIKTFHTEPSQLAIADAIRHRENYNPFRTETREHMIYEDTFKTTAKDLESCALKTLLKAVPGIQRGSHILSKSHTRS